MSVLGPTTETLSFAPPKESIQRKGGPDAAYSLRSSLLNGVAERGFLPLRQRAASMPLPSGLIPQKTAMLGVEIRDHTLPLENNLSIREQQSNPATQRRCSPPMPRRAPERLSRIARRGTAGMRCVGGGAGKPLLPTLDKRSGAQDQSGIGVAFSLGTFFWPNKRKYLGCRAETRH